jgi:hypothetical protein
MTVAALPDSRFLRARLRSGSNRAFSLVFHNLQPSPQGKLMVSMTPAGIMPCINANEIEDESH